MSSYLVGIGGASCSGKSTIVHYLSNLLKANIIHQDKFFKSDSEIEMIHIKDDMSFLNWDGLESVDMMAFNQLLYQTRENGIPVNVTGDNIPTLFSKLCPLKELVMQSIVAKITAIGRRIILVDGFLLYAKKSTIEMFDLKIFMNAPYQILKERRGTRSKYITIEGYWEDPLGYFDNVVYPEYLRNNQSAILDAKDEEYLSIDTSVLSVEESIILVLESILQELL